jgi:hypothetical protein
MNGLLSTEKAQELQAKKEKDGLLGKIEHYYQLAGRTPPIGLAASDTAALRKHLEFAKTLKK